MRKADISSLRKWRTLEISEVIVIWSFIQDYIEQSCERSFWKYSPDDFLKIILSGDATLWIGSTNDRIDGAAITDIIQFPNKKYARVTIGMGENPLDLSTFITEFEQWAKLNGCEGVQSEMRPGFSKCFVSEGWRNTHVLMEKSFYHA